jgi:hypothetical protein
MLKPLFDEEFVVPLPHFDMHLVDLCLEYYDKLLVKSEMHIPVIVYLAAENKRQLKEYSFTIKLVNLVTKSY